MYKHADVPQHEEADHGVGAVAHGRRFGAIFVATLPRSENARGDQRRRSAHNVNTAGAGDVDDAQVVQEAVLGPHPVRRDAVDDGVEQREDDVRAQARPLGHGAADDRRRRRRERQLEDERGVNRAHRLAVGRVDEPVADAAERI